jgi:F-box protein 9
MAEEASSVLEQFRQQWRDEVTARSKQGTQQPTLNLEESSSKRPGGLKPEWSFLKPPSRHPAAEVKDDADEEDNTDPETSTLIQQIEGLKVKDVDEDAFSVRGSSREPKSALDHYEKAVEKESQGNLGDSLSHYRKAYRLDAKVDQSYKNKHFPAKSKPADPNPSNASATVPSTAHHSSKEPTILLPADELVESFANVAIIGAEPLIPGDRPPPCPIKDLPHEVLLELLRHTAIIDPALFVRMARVCKKLAYHVYTEKAIWKRVALGPEFGLSGQLYSFATDVQGREVIDRLLENEGATVPSITYDAEQVHVGEKDFAADEDWREIFHSHPRVRFTGVYISTVNYTRAGATSASQVTWNSPVHIITYYRYLRFFRDGTVISLLTTHEPTEVVHHLSRENVSLVRAGDRQTHPLNFTSGAPALSAGQREGAVMPPTAQQLMKHALRGRWRMVHPSESNDQAVSNIATGSSGEGGDVHIETEGAGPRYLYTMHLSLKSVSRAKKAVKNTKLQWKGFWSYNQHSNTWSDFQLKNDRAFYFSRVRTYGLGY